MEMRAFREIFSGIHETAIALWARDWLSHFVFKCGVKIMKLQYFTEASLAVQIHIIAAMLALGIGIYMWRAKKGTRTHKLIGRGFLLLMLATAISAIFIRHINNGSFSWIHIFVPITFIAAFETVYFIRKGNIRHHKRAVKGLFFGALLIPGIFSFMPGRTMYMLFFG